MIWYRNLYTGPLIAPKKESIIDAVDRGIYPPQVFLLTVQRGERCQLDIMEARQLKHDYIRNHCALIVGLAAGRPEAVGLLKRLVQDVYADTGDADIQAWLSEEH